MSRCIIRGATPPQDPALARNNPFESRLSPKPHPALRDTPAIPAYSFTGRRMNIHNYR